MINEPYSPQSSLNSSLNRTLSILVRLVAVLLFIAITAMALIGLSALIGSLVLLGTGLSYSSEATTIAGAIIVCIAIPVLFLFDRILSKLLERFGFNWTVFGHKW